MKPIVLFFQSTHAKSWKDKLTGVYDYAEKSGWQIQVIEAGSDTGTIRDALQKWNPIGCLVDRGLQNGRPPIRLFTGIPVVFLDQNPANAGNCTTLTHNSAASVILAAEEFLRIGLQRLAYVAWNKPCFWSQERQMAFDAYTRKRHVEARVIVLSGRIETDLRELPKPCGVVCVNDLAAQKVMSEATHAGIAIPDELAIIGIDDDAFICEHTQPPLTSVDPGFVDAGYQLASLLHKRISNPRTPHRHETYGPKVLIRRESSRWLPKVDRRAREAIEYIRRNFSDPDLSVAGVVAHMGCSRSLADLLIRRATGSSLMTEILSARLDHAYKLLRNPRQAIDAIPMLCGYRSIPFFKRIFKRETGLTMREWRKRNVTSRS